MNMADLKIVFGFIIVMGINRMSDMKNHWSNRRFLGTPDIYTVMARDRFLELKRSLRFYDQRLGKSDDPLYKIRSILVRIPEVSQKIYTQEQNLSVDESLVHFEGRFYISSLSQEKLQSVVSNYFVSQIARLVTF